MGCCSSSVAAARGESAHGGATPYGTVAPTQAQLADIVGKKWADVRDKYAIGKVIGEGSFGKVHMCTEVATGVERVVKVLPKRAMKYVEDIEDVKRETGIFQHVGNHPNIVQLYGAYEDSRNVYLVQELCRGGDLIDAVIEKGRFSEADAARAVADILSVLVHMHSLGVCHRDIKPDNFVWADKECTRVKAIDFGLSVFYRIDEPLDEACGTPMYVAPELLRQSYGPPVDVWAVGVVLYILLSGDAPYNGAVDDVIFHKIKHQEPPMEGPHWQGVSEGAKNAVRRMLRKDPKSRPTAAQMMRDPWIAGGASSTAQLQDSVVARLREFTSMNEVTQAICRVMSGTLDETEIEGLRALFYSIDGDHSGTVSAIELHQHIQAMYNGGFKQRSHSDEKLRRRTSSFSVPLDWVPRSGQIDWDTFLAAAMQQRRTWHADQLTRAFKVFDLDGDGKITAMELIAAVRQQGNATVRPDKKERVRRRSRGSSGGDGVPHTVLRRETLAGVEEARVRAIMDEIDTDHDGFIDYEEFVEYFTNQTQIKGGSRSRRATRAMRAMDQTSLERRNSKYTLAPLSSNPMAAKPCVAPSQPSTELDPRLRHGSVGGTGKMTATSPLESSVIGSGAPPSGGARVRLEPLHHAATEVQPRTGADGADTSSKRFRAVQFSQSDIQLGHDAASSSGDSSEDF